MYDDRCPYCGSDDISVDQEGRGYCWDCTRDFDYDDII